MDQALVDQLWQSTNKQEERITDLIEREGYRSLLDYISTADNATLPRHYYFSSDQKQLYLSFHQEMYNQMVHHHDFFEIIYACRGQAIGVINGEEIRLEQGCVCIMNPKAVHYFKEYRAGEDLILNILLTKEMFQKSMYLRLIEDPILNSFFTQYRLENAGQDSFMFFPSLEENIEPIIELLIKEFLNEQLYSSVTTESLLTVLLAIVLRNFKKSQRENTSTSSKIVEIYDYLHQNYQTADLMSAVAHFHYHPKYLSSLIHKQTGKTFKQILNEIKLQNAANFLAFSEYSVEQISELIGYQDTSYFYKIFKEAYGRSPTQYRQKYL
jgi:AraC-like DNA-binding protein/mannose-6-phosphate isomerase-like protein (cupin superfamily)